MNKAVLVAAALLVSPLTLSGQEVRDKDRFPPPGQAIPVQKGTEPGAPTGRTEEQPPSAFKERVADAIETVENACAADIDDLCGRVPAGEGRLALCMIAHEDMLSARCRFGLYRAARRLRSDLGRVAEACLQEVRTICGEAGKVRQCLDQKKGSLSSSCQTIVGAVAQGVHRLKGLTVYSSDNKNLGQIVDVVRGPDDKLQSIQVDIGRVLGLGTKVITITADKFEQLPGIKLLLSEGEVRSLPDAKQ
jgi:PRC-barrel domain protein